MTVRLSTMDKLTVRQIVALTFALTEGRVGPGCQGWARNSKPMRATNAAIGALIDLGLAYPVEINDGEVWVLLTVKGDAEARRVFAETRGYAWKGKSFFTAEEKAAGA